MSPIHMISQRVLALSVKKHPFAIEKSFKHHPSFIYFFVLLHVPYVHSFYCAEKIFFLSIALLPCTHPTCCKLHHPAFPPYACLSVPRWSFHKIFQRLIPLLRLFPQMSPSSGRSSWRRWAGRRGAAWALRGRGRWSPSPSGRRTTARGSDTR